MTPSSLYEESLRENQRTAPCHASEIFDSVDDSYDYWNTPFSTILDEYLLMKRMKARAKDVPYMTSAWKTAIRAKRRFSKRFSQSETPENFELKRKWRNEATRQRRIAIRNYWSEVSDNLRQNPKNFYKTFKPFLDRKDKGDGTRDIHLNIDGNVVKDQEGVTEHLVEYFSTMASGIDGDNVESLNESDFKEHSSLKSISTMIITPKNSFCFRPVSYHEVKDAMDKSEARKVARHDGILPRMLKLMAEELAPSHKGSHICELNNDTDESASHLALAERELYTHHAVENACHCKPCPGKYASCQVGFTDKGYRCDCRKGYGGKQCNEGIDISISKEKDLNLNQITSYSETEIKPG
ncbi:uncharacterized protein LOC110058075 [Orbicella faveolata]|uniref:uncharacterized protein LOC110058075 n=1 Tax=Orbicella faveolata TaxID=48498 RepID=UPI0009E62D22|nr:uncharacterized protein LOC110058075 [Orbicella faveolata]